MMWCMIPSRGEFGWDWGWLTWGDLNRFPTPKILFTFLRITESAEDDGTDADDTRMSGCKGDQDLESGWSDWRISLFLYQHIRSKHGTGVLSLEEDHKLIWTWDIWSWDETIIEKDDENRRPYLEKLFPKPIRVHVGWYVSNKTLDWR